MEAIITVYVLSLVVASGVLMYSLLTAEKPKHHGGVDRLSNLKRLRFFKSKVNSPRF
jgi:hypothetical protein